MIPHERELVEEFHKEPFVLLGVNSDESRSALAKIIKNERITGPISSMARRAKGEVARQWNVSGWPTLYIIDDKRCHPLPQPREKRLGRCDRQIAQGRARQGDRTKK